MYDNIICNIPIIFCFKVVNMAGKPKYSFYRDNIIELYKSFVSIPNIAAQLFINHKTVRKTLQDAGIDTSLGNRNITPPNLEKVLELYNKGIGVAGIAKRLGYSRMYMTGFFKRNGIEQRNRKEQQIERMKNTTKEEIDRLVYNAHLAAKGRNISFNELAERAKTRYNNQVFHNSKYEVQFSNYLHNKNISFERQFPCGAYNLDFLIGNIAVEIFGGQWHNFGKHAARFSERTKYILDSGYFLICVFIEKGDDFQTIVDNQIIPCFNKFSRDKSGITKYRVIWGNSEYATGGCCNDDNFPLIRPTENIRDITTGRYKSVPKDTVVMCG